MFKRFCLAVLIAVGLLAIPVSNASAEAPYMECLTPNGSQAQWTNNGYHIYYTGYGQAGFNPQGAPTWCISNDSQGVRLVFQRNGDLTIWRGAHTGDQLLWHSGTANQGVRTLGFYPSGIAGLDAGNGLIWYAGIVFQGQSVGEPQCAVDHCPYPGSYYWLLNGAQAYEHGTVNRNGVITQQDHIFAGPWQ